MGVIKKELVKLILHMAKERLHGRIVPAVSLTRHRLFEPSFGDKEAGFRVRIVHTLVGMENGVGMNIAVQFE